MLGTECMRTCSTYNLNEDTHGLSGLRLVCRCFRDAVTDIPTYIQISTKLQARKLPKAPFNSWEN